MAMSRFLIIAASVLGLLAVALGAFAAHGLRIRVSPEQLHSFEVGVRYQMFHALALLALAALASRLHPPEMIVAGWCFTFGTILFSGSIYLLALRTPLGLEGWRWLGPVTPLGGLTLMVGWAAVLVSALRS